MNLFQTFTLTIDFLIFIFLFVRLCVLDDFKGVEG
jgi:hypothetical protein